MRIRESHYERADLIGLERYLLNNLDWLDEELGSFEDDYLLIDCPGSSPSPTLLLASPHLTLFSNTICRPDRTIHPHPPPPPPALSPPIR